MTRIRKLTLAMSGGLAMFGTVACGSSPDREAGEPEIGELGTELIGGNPTTDLNAVVAVIALYPNGVQEKCTGTFISERDVLTSAHCLMHDGLSPSQVSVVFGKSWSGTRKRATRWAVNPEYSENGISADDIGIVVFREPMIDPSQVIQLISGGNHEGEFVGANALQLGYGAANADGRSGAGTKRWGWVSITENNGLQLEYQGIDSGACSGDSGGPITGTLDGVWVLVGIHSGGSSGCAVNTSGVAAIPFNHIRFIQENDSIVKGPGHG